MPSRRGTRIAWGGAAILAIAGFACSSDRATNASPPTYASDVGTILGSRCDTCHGSGTRSYPPRDGCFYSDRAGQGAAHAAHVESSASRQGGLPCSTCHPVPDERVIGGAHGNGSVEIVFDRAVVGAEASYDRSTKNCAVGCHDRGGARPRPAWDTKG